MRLGISVAIIGLTKGMPKPATKFTDNNRTTKVKRAIISFTHDPVCDYMWRLLYKRTWQGTCGGGDGTLARLMAGYGFLSTLVSCLGGGMPTEMLEYARQEHEKSKVPFTSEQINAIEEWAVGEGIPFNRK